MSSISAAPMATRQPGSLPRPIKGAAAVGAGFGRAGAPTTSSSLVPALRSRAQTAASNARDAAAAPRSARCPAQRRPVVRLIGALLGSIVGVDRDVAVGQIAGPDRGRAGPAADPHGDLDLAALEMRRDRPFVQLGHARTLARDRMAAEADRQPAELDRLARLADRHGDAAP